MRTLQIDLTPEEYHIPEQMQAAIARKLGVGVDTITAMRVRRRSIDCRRGVLYHTDLEVALEGETLPDTQPPSRLSALDIHVPQRDVVIVGAGPAGLFAAMRCIEVGLRPIIVERGKPVENRKYDIATLTRERRVNPDSNWCFGEGGAGTYSDGKLYTRSTKRGDVGAVLGCFVRHGADPSIMLDAHAHIGTDRLSGIIANMRHYILEHGGEYHFNTRMQDLLIRDNQVCGIATAEGDTIEGCAVILATGHSARDVYHLFHRHGWSLEAKPFALGVRVEHPQELINRIQYHSAHYSPYLPAAAYSLTTQVGGHGVFSFCMCPGGVIVPAATADGQQVVNGMSNSRRNSPHANSGIAVTVSLNEELGLNHEVLQSPLALLEFQQQVEQRMFHAGGDAINAPSQRLTDFLKRKPSSRLNKTGYMGQVVSAPLHELLPPFVVDSLIQGFKDFDRKMHGFITEEASLLAVESRTSSPVRIPRDKETLQHPQLQGLYPCGEGAGYAGGIVSSALDGIRCIDALALQQ